MKKSTILSAALIAATLATLAGCDSTGTSEQTETLPYKITKVAPEGTYITTITYTPNSFSQEKETTTLNGQPFSERSAFKAENSGSSYVLTSYSGGATSYEKIVSAYGYFYYNTYYETKKEVFTLASATDATGTLKESLETSYTDNTANIKEVIHKVGGTEVMRQYDYDYTYFTNYSANPYYTYMKVENGGEPVKMCYYVTQLSYNGVTGGYSVDEYTIYKGWVDSSDTGKGTVVESCSDYENTMKVLNEETGVLESTDYTVDYATITVRH